jgi:hypothetical protein
LLESLVTSAPSFLAENWGREAALSRGHERASNRNYLSPNDYLRDLPNLLDSQAIAPPYLRIVRPGDRAAPSELWSEDGQIGHSPTAKRLRWQGVLDEVRKGSTLVLDDFQEQCPRAREVCSRLAEDLAIPFNAVLFITPPGRQGLHLHLDNKEVFALQLAGKKAWRVYKQRRPVPAQSTVILEDLDDQVPESWEVTESDCLYIPAGAPHAATAVPGQLSIHLSFAGQPLYWSDLIHRLISEILADGTFLGTTPVARNPRDLYPDVMLRIAALCDRLTNALSPADLHSVIEKRWQTTLPDKRVASLLDSLLAISGPDVNELCISLASDAKIIRTENGSDGVMVEVGNRKLSISEAFHSLLPKMLHGDLPVSEIAAEVGIERARQTVAELVRHGIATVSDRGVSASVGVSSNQE